MQYLEPNAMNGRIIILPALNMPAVIARSRVSPIDQGNMNRSFPGDGGPSNAGQGPTDAIAAFLTTHLIPRADAIVDFHSGGTATQYVDCGFTCHGPNTNLNGRNWELAKVFGAPFTMLCDIDGSGGDFDTTAHNLNTPFLACELGGLGRFSQSSFQVGWAGLHRVMGHLGIVEHHPPVPATRFIAANDSATHITSTNYGLAEFHVLLGDNVRKGDPVVTLYDMHNLQSDPIMMPATQDGVIAVVRRNPLVDLGDHLCLIAPEISQPGVA
jgi:predicted deacylase